MRLPVHELGDLLLQLFVLTDDSSFLRLLIFEYHLVLRFGLLLLRFFDVVRYLLHQGLDRVESGFVFFKTSINFEDIAHYYLAELVLLISNSLPVIVQASQPCFVFLLGLQLFGLWVDWMVKVEEIIRRRPVVLGELVLLLASY